MMATPKLLTVILNYRTPEMSLRAVEAALREMAGIDGAINLVDNASGDGSFEMLRDAVKARGWDRVCVLQSGHNGGFGAGNNFGIRAGLPGGERPDYVYILNSDAFPDAGAIRTLLDYLETQNHVGIAGSYIHGPEGDPHITAFRFPSIASEFEGAARFGPVSRLLARRAVPMPLPAINRRVDWLAGASMMMRFHVVDRIGLFDERFFLYFEETDLCLRAARAGYITHYVRDSHVTHIGSVSTGMKDWVRVPPYWFESRLHYFVKNHGPLYAALATLAHATGGALWRLRRVIQRKPPVDPPGFLRTLLLNDLRAAASGLAGLVRRAPANGPEPGRPNPSTTGDPR